MRIFTTEWDKKFCIEIGAVYVHTKNVDEAFICISEEIFFDSIVFFVLWSANSDTDKKLLLFFLFFFQYNK